MIPSFFDNLSCKFSKGYLCIQGAKPDYYPGEMVQGSIFLRVTHPISAKHIEIQVRGKEKANFTDTIQK